MPNQFWPMSAVRPEARKLIATPEISWLPLRVIEARPWSSASRQRGEDAGEEPDPGRSGDRREGAGGEGGGQHLALEADVEDAGALGEEAGEAGEQQRRREPEARSGELQDGLEVHQAGLAAQAQEGALDRHAHQVLQRAGEEDDQRLDHHDHVAADLRHLEGELGAALVEDAEEDRRQDHADRMRAAHQRHRDADEAGAADVVEHQPVLEAHDDVERHHARPWRPRAAWR